MDKDNNEPEIISGFGMSEKSTETLEKDKIEKKAPEVTHDSFGIKDITYRYIASLTGKLGKTKKVKPYYEILKWFYIIFAVLAIYDFVIILPLRMPVDGILKANKLFTACKQISMTLPSIMTAVQAHPAAGLLLLVINFIPFFAALKLITHNFAYEHAKPKYKLDNNRVEYLSDNITVFAEIQGLLLLATVIQMVAPWLLSFTNLAYLTANLQFTLIIAQAIMEIIWFAMIFDESEIVSQFHSNCH